MHPTIISIGPFALRSYGLMLAIGFFSGIILAAWRAKKSGENPDNIYNLSVWIVISSLLGARLYYIITHYYEFRAEDNLPLLIRFFTEFKNMFWPISSSGQIGINGLVLYGGLIMGTLVTAAYLYTYKLNVFKYLDFFAPSLGLGEFFTRIGCFLSGCCFGKPTECAFGVIFPGDSAAGMYFPDIHIHPSQLYNSFAGLLICVTLLLLERYKRFDGYTALLYFILYAIGRFFIDYTRYYETSLTFWGLSHNQILSVVIFAITAPLLIYFTIKSSSNRKNQIKE